MVSTRSRNQKSQVTPGGNVSKRQKIVSKRQNNDDVPGRGKRGQGGAARVEPSDDDHSSEEDFPLSQRFQHPSTTSRDKQRSQRRRRTAPTLAYPASDDDKAAVPRRSRTGKLVAEGASGTDSEANVRDSDAPAPAPVTRKQRSTRVNNRAALRITSGSDADVPAPVTRNRRRVRGVQREAAADVPSGSDAVASPPVTRKPRSARRGDGEDADVQRGSDSDAPPRIQNKRQCKQATSDAAAVVESRSDVDAPRRLRRKQESADVHVIDMLAGDGGDGSDSDSSLRVTRRGQDARVMHSPAGDEMNASDSDAPPRGPRKRRGIIIDDDEEDEDNDSASEPSRDAGRPSKDEGRPRGKRLRRGPAVADSTPNKPVVGGEVGSGGRSLRKRETEPRGQRLRDLAAMQRRQAERLKAEYGGATLGSSEDEEGGVGGGASGEGGADRGEGTEAESVEEPAESSDDESDEGSDLGGFLARDDEDEEVDENSDVLDDVDEGEGEEDGDMDDPEDHTMLCHDLISEMLSAGESLVFRVYLEQLALSAVDPTFMRRSLYQDVYRKAEQRAIDKKILAERDEAAGTQWVSTAHMNKDEWRRAIKELPVLRSEWLDGDKRNEDLLSDEENPEYHPCQACGACRGGTQEVDFMDAGSPQRRPQRPEGRKRAPNNTWRKETFWVASACFARARVFHALQHYVAHLEAHVKRELVHKWTKRVSEHGVCEPLTAVRDFLSDGRLVGKLYKNYTQMCLEADYYNKDSKTGRRGGAGRYVSPQGKTRNRGPLGFARTVDDLLKELYDMSAGSELLPDALRRHLPADLKPLWLDRQLAEPGIPACPQCGEPFEARTSWTERNPGRQFYKCDACDVFQWVDEVEDAAAPEQAPVSPAALAPIFRAGEVTPARVAGPGRADAFSDASVAPSPSAPEATPLGIRSPRWGGDTSLAAATAAVRSVTEPQLGSTPWPYQASLAALGLQPGAVGSVMLQHAQQAQQAQQARASGASPAAGAASAASGDVSAGFRPGGGRRDVRPGGDGPGASLATPAGGHGGGAFCPVCSTAIPPNTPALPSDAGRPLCDSCRSALLTDDAPDEPDLPGGAMQSQGVYARASQGIPSPAYKGHSSRNGEAGDGSANGGPGPPQVTLPEDTTGGASQAGHEGGPDRTLPDAGGAPGAAATPLARAYATGQGGDVIDLTDELPAITQTRSEQGLDAAGKMDSGERRMTGSEPAIDEEGAVASLPEGTAALEKNADQGYSSPRHQDGLCDGGGNLLLGVGPESLERGAGRDSSPRQVQGSNLAQSGSPESGNPAEDVAAGDQGLGPIAEGSAQRAGGPGVTNPVFGTRDEATQVWEMDMEMDTEVGDDAAEGSAGASGRGGDLLAVTDDVTPHVEAEDRGGASHQGDEVMGKPGAAPGQASDLGGARDAPTEEQHLEGAGSVQTGRVGPRTGAAAGEASNMRDGGVTPGERRRPDAAVSTPARPIRSRIGRGSGTPKTPAATPGQKTLDSLWANAKSTGLRSPATPVSRLL